MSLTVTIVDNCLRRLRKAVLAADEKVIDTRQVGVPWLKDCDPEALISDCGASTDRSIYIRDTALVSSPLLTGRAPSVRSTWA